MSVMMEKVVVRELALWAVANKRPRPTTEEGRQALIAEFVRAGGLDWRKRQAMSSLVDLVARQIPMSEQSIVRNSDIAPDQAMLEYDGVSTEVVEPHPIPERGQFQDDFEKLVQDREQAMVDAGGEDIDRDFLLREQENAEANVVAPHACANPASWNRGVIGGAVKVQPSGDPAVAGQFTQVAHWPGDDRETVPVAITVMPRIDPALVPLVATGVFRPIGRVRWGTRGAQFELVFDVGIGAQFSIAASSAYLDVGLDVGSDTAMLISGALSFWGVSSAGSQQTRTDYTGTIANGGNVTRTRPQFASTIVDVGRSVATVPFTIDILDANATVIDERTIAASTFVQSPIYLPNDCRGIKISNTDAGNPAVFRVIWGLDVG
jgi:hypothetical protein